MTTYILCACRSGAKFYQCTSLKERLSLVEDIPHPEGKLKEQDINSDRPGAKKGGGSPLLHGTSTPQSPIDRLADNFAREVAKNLDHKVISRSFDQLVLCGDPKFLGKMRNFVTKRTEERVIGSLSKDLYEASPNEVLEKCREIITDHLIAA